MTTPARQRSRRSSGAPNTPGSVASESDQIGVPWHVKKLIAQELEVRFPISLCPGDTHSVHALLDSGTQPLSRLLDDIVAADPENNIVVGKRGDRIRVLIGDLIQQWKLKSKVDYKKKVIQKHKVVLIPSRKARYTPRANQKTDVAVSDNEEEEDSEASELTEDAPAKKQPAKKAPTKKKAAADIQEPPCSPPIKSVTTGAATKKAPESTMSGDTCRLLSDGTLEGEDFVIML